MSLSRAAKPSLPSGPTSNWDIAHIITKLELGGAQLATLRAISDCPFPTGNRYLLHGPGGMLDERAEQNPSIKDIAISALERKPSAINDTLALHQLIRTIRQIKSQNKTKSRLLVHTHSSKAGILGRVAARRAGADLIVHSIHGFGHGHGPASASQRLMLSLEKRAGAITDAFTGDSAANISQASDEGIIRNQPTAVIHCGIDLPNYKADPGETARLRAQLGIGKTDPVVLNISCLKPQKDPTAFVLCAARVLRQEPTTVFLLVGDGELRSEVETLARGMGIGNRFLCLGWRHDIPALLGVADVFALTSRWEGLPQSISQAMAVGLPVIANDVDGVCEAVRDGINGFLLPPGRHEEFSNAVVRVIADKKLRHRFGAASREIAPKFSSRRMLTDLDDFYRLILGD